ncbi:TPA: hypothetical protein ACX3HX_003940, partial [Raoultella ornithinolytica]
MAELPTPTQKTVPSDDIRDHVYAGGMLDKVVTSTDFTYTDRLGGVHYTVDGIKAEGDAVIEETRQNLIPLSRQYMTLAAAQADIANIPEGSTTYVRSTDGSSLADEYINNGGTLEATGRKMPSYELIEPLINLIESVLYADNDEYSRSPADSAIMDKNHRWLLQWHGDEIWLKNADIKGTLKIQDLQASGNISFDDAVINNMKVVSLDADTISIGGVEIPVSLASPDEYARSPADSAKMDK